MASPYSSWFGARRNSNIPLKEVCVEVVSLAVSSVLALPENWTPRARNVQENNYSSCQASLLDSWLARGAAKRI